MRTVSDDEHRLGREPPEREQQRAQRRRSAHWASSSITTAGAASPKSSSRRAPTARWCTPLLGRPEQLLGDAEHQVGFRLDRARAQHARAGADLLQEPFDEHRLADPGLALDDHEPRRFGQRRAQRGQLGDPSDEGTSRAFRGCRPPEAHRPATLTPEGLRRWIQTLRTVVPPSRRASACASSSPVAIVVATSAIGAITLSPRTDSLE